MEFTIMMLNPSRMFLMSIFVGFFLAGTNFIIMDFAFSENFSFSVFSPEMEEKPTSGIVNEKTNKVYLTDFFGGKLLILDGETNETLEYIEVVRTPFGVGINPETNLIYVGGEHVDTVSILNATTNRVIKEISLKDPYDIAINPNNNIIYVTSDKANSVSVIDGKVNEIVTSFEVLVPCGIAVNVSTGMVYVTSESENLVHVWDGNTNQQITTIPVQESPRGVTVNPITNMIYVTNQETNTITIIDGSTNKITSSINVGETPRRVVVDSQSNIIYVSNQGSKDISVIDGFENKVIETIPVSEPFELAINTKTGKLYSMYYGGNLSIITKNTQQSSPLKQISSGVNPQDVKCQENLVLILKNNESPACVKQNTAKILESRGWGNIPPSV